MSLTPALPAAGLAGFAVAGAVAHGRTFRLRRRAQASAFERSMAELADAMRSLGAAAARWRGTSEQLAAVPIDQWVALGEERALGDPRPGEPRDAVACCSRGVRSRGRSLGDTALCPLHGLTSVVAVGSLVLEPR